MMPAGCNKTKTLVWTKLGQKISNFGLIGSKNGLSGLLKRLFVGYFLPLNPLHAGY